MNTLYLFILLPLILSNSLHMLVVKRNAAAAWAKPVHTRLFGQNKTWRGIVLLPLLNGFFFAALNVVLPRFEASAAFSNGAVLGMVYMLSELPNSWLKRRIGISAGQKADRHGWFFMLLDKMDAATGVSLASKFIFQMPWLSVLVLFLSAVIVHTTVSWLLVVLGVKKRF